MELPGPLDHSFDARGGKSQIYVTGAIFLTLAIYGFTHLCIFLTVNKINSRHRRPGSVTRTFVGCRTRTKLKAGRVNKSLGRTSATWVIAALCALQSSYLCRVRGNRRSLQRGFLPCSCNMKPASRGMWYGRNLEINWKIDGALVTPLVMKAIFYVHLMNLESLRLV